MAKGKKRKRIIDRPLGLRIAGCIIVICIAAAICAYGCFYMILKGPYKSYRADFVKHICTETRYGFVVEKIIGQDEIDAIVGLPPEENAEVEQKEGEAKQ